MHEARRVSAVLDAAVRERLVGRLRVATVTFLAAYTMQGMLGRDPLIGVSDRRLGPDDSEVAGRASIFRSGPRDLRPRVQRDRQNNREHQDPHCLIPQVASLSARRSKEIDGSFPAASAPTIEHGCKKHSSQSPPEVASAALTIGQRSASQAARLQISSRKPLRRRKAGTTVVNRLRQEPSPARGAVDAHN
jgi:hypothetical protein